MRNCLAFPIGLIITVRYPLHGSQLTRERTMIHLFYLHIVGIANTHGTHGGIGIFLTKIGIFTVGTRLQVQGYWAFFDSKVALQWFGVIASRFASFGAVTVRPLIRLPLDLP